ncbi:TetR/AcrR family transcriptional regulator [uncultured Jatrophihabitans sp.]|uniref:TetR/AcrR family transcriptional regulator n=1 Tax=uncultured Jatrophihabitans sp. TaxID=1610747 RepID=UPI0035CBACC7
MREILARARDDELQLLQSLRLTHADTSTTAVAATVWEWLVSAEHRRVLTLWVDTYARSVVEPEGPCADFAAATVRDWLEVFTDLGAGQDDTDRTLLLAVLRGCLFDLLATYDVDRTTAAVTRYLTTCQPDS